MSLPFIKTCVLLMFSFFFSEWAMHSCSLNDCSLYRAYTLLYILFHVYFTVILEEKEVKEANIKYIFLVL